MRWMKATLASILVFSISWLGSAQAKEIEAAAFFSLADPQGQVHTLEDYKGRPLIIHFWATWCPYCKKLQPGLERIHLDNQDTDLAVLGISFNEDEGAEPQNVLQARGITFPTLIHGESAARAYGVPGTPTTVFIDRRGNKVWTTNISDPNNPKLKQAAAYILNQ